jgi:hypothetical protein
MALKDRLRQLERGVASRPPRPRDPEEVRAQIRAVMTARADHIQALGGTRSLDPVGAHLDRWSVIFATSSPETQEDILDTFMMIGAEEWLQLLVGTALPGSAGRHSQHALREEATKDGS